ncbi:MAG: DNA/RNA non-specific endonuclease [Anaerostipes sp.]|nr:DNA/RNA non-specific endonuclease [Anaerostipes sp.]
MKTGKLKKYVVGVILFLCLFGLWGCNDSAKTTTTTATTATIKSKQSKAPSDNGKLYTVVNNNKPEFSSKDMTTKSYESYSKLDRFGRCGAAIACIGRDIMPKTKRGAIGMIKPSGWHTVKYDFVDGKYLYNRCHLIGYQLTGENANKRNLITGTRSLNVDGMLPFENMVADYVKETGKHILYRVTPVFSGNNLVADGVKMEGYSIEDKGKSVEFNVFVYNKESGVSIDYKTGNSSENGNTTEKTEAATASSEEQEIRGNKKSKVYHCPGQRAYNQMGTSKNLIVFHSEKEAQKAGYRKATY